MALGVIELCGIGAAVSAGLGGPVALVRWCAGSISQKVEESEKKQTTLIVAQSVRINDIATKVDQLDRLRTNDVERIVKLETNLSNLEKGQERIEHALDTMKHDSDKGRAEILDSIREMRSVTVKT